MSFWLFLKADYWKSQDRKYCDFCKCWIADNKPSVEFHEKGRRHQENVKKKLRTITRDSAKAQKESDKNDYAIRQMEAAAMRAYRVDVANNADLTSISINNKVQSENLTIGEKSTRVWQEVKSAEGTIYYWNTLTNETQYSPPNEPFTSLKEQKNQQDADTLKQMKAVDKHRKTEALMRIQEQKKQDAEERSREAREKLKQFRVEEVPEPVYGPIIEPGKTDPYGGWQTVKERKPIDYQLPPQPEYYAEPVVVEEPIPVVREFKEKTIDSIDDGACSSSSTSFKKRKIASNNKHNRRQRLDDD